MKIKKFISPTVKHVAQKNISRFLTVGIILNNIYFNTNASNVDIPNRYETLEGEYITIDDSMEGELHEIEIFGNTVQDENNLEDIQSVGDLYVDENGDPILDDEGKKQYRIEVLTNKKNIFNIEDFKLKSLSNIEFDNEGYLLLNKGNFKTYEIPKNTYNPQKTYTFSAVTNKNENGIEDCIALEFYYTDGTYNQVYIGAWGTSVTSNYTKTIDKILIRYPWDHRGHDAKIKDIQLEESNIKTDFENYTETKNFILIPDQLYKVGNTSDRLYWDKTTKEYIIEKNIVKFDITRPEDFGLVPFDYSRAWGGNNDTDTHNLISVGFKGDSLWKSTYGTKFIIKSNYKILPFHSTVFNNGQPNEYCYLVFGIEKGIISDIDSSQEIKDFVKNNMSDILIKKELSEEIKIPASKTVKFPTYDEKTHIYVNSENGINPILKVTVDKLEQVVQEAVDIAVSNPTSSNLTLARLYVNDLSESLYKDQLQEQLNQLFSSDMVLERQSASANLDVYIKSENMLSMSLDTNSVSFEEYSGTAPMENLSAVNITINSSLPYTLNAYMPTEILNNDGSNKMDIDVLNIRESSETEYKQFENVTDKIVLKDDCLKGNNINHAIDLKLDGSDAHKADIYKTVIKFEAEQK